MLAALQRTSRGRQQVLDQLNSVTTFNIGQMLYNSFYFIQPQSRSTYRKLHSQPTITVSRKPYTANNTRA